MVNTLKIGTRGSKLALWQADWVKSAIEVGHPGLTTQIEIIKTKGDKILDVPLAKVGGKGLFVKEIEDALTNGRIDLAVHSMKDMPAEIPEGLCIGAIPKRENPQDVLISKQNRKFFKLRNGAHIGTSSLRRAAQLLYARPDIVIHPLRGNLDTRLKKLETENLDAIVLAAAGVHRLGVEDRIAEYLDEKLMLPAVGQGALCIEIRKEDHDVKSVLTSLDHYDTRLVVLGERSFLNRLRGGCQVPVAGHGQLKNQTLTLYGLVASLDGRTLIKENLSGPGHDSERIGKQLADRLLSMGADKILKETIIENEAR